MMNMGWKKTQKKMKKEKMLGWFLSQNDDLASSRSVNSVVPYVWLRLQISSSLLVGRCPPLVILCWGCNKHAWPPWEADAATILEVEAHQERVLCDLKKQYSDLLKQLEAEKKRMEKLNQMRTECQGCSWFDTPIDELSYEELKIRSAAVKELGGKILKKVEERLAQGSAPSVANSGVGSDFPVTDPKAAP